ncbi:MAG: hypothetical protein IPM51_15670 [Sphingobacteriaceae bacterium]|nr:hypothetical protein [Sphingobacteriaceae bacterium]
MKSSTIHHLNTGLILLSCMVAFFIPFELFLFSYAVLGPLHYLTEIGWLHKKNYFTKGKYDFVLLSIACSILVFWNFFPPKNSGLMADIILFSALCSIVFVFMKDWLYRGAVILLALLVVGFVNDTTHYFTWAAIFLPTIIHVFIFTWAFMLFGVLKEKSWPGLVSIFTLIICAILLITIQPQNLFYNVSEYIQKSYSNFTLLNFSLVNLFGLDSFTEVSQVFTSNAGFVIMRFIAFAYTYHYLNWFSKTSVIKWHEVSRKSLTITLIIWISSVGLYAYNYSLGMNVLFFLSFLHVFLEFPLNVVSFSGIGKALGSFSAKKS